MLLNLKWILSGLFSKYLVGVGIPGNASEWRIFFRKFQLLLLSIHSHGTVHACCWKKVQNYNHFLTTTNIIDSLFNNTSIDANMDGYLWQADILPGPPHMKNSMSHWSLAIIRPYSFSDRENIKGLPKLDILVRNTYVVIIFLFHSLKWHMGGRKKQLWERGCW